MPPTPHGKGNTVPPDGLPSGPVCYYCKCRGHVKSECKALLKKATKPMTVATPANPCTSIPREFLPFISSGEVVLLNSKTKTPITILRDTGAVQSLILKRVLPFSNDSAVGQEVHV